jgi:hypothetical protein
MKINLILLLTLITFNISSQSLFNKYEKGTLYLRNGANLKGFIKITVDNKIKFKKTLEDKKQIFDYKKVDKLKFSFKDEYVYKITAKRKKTLIKRTIKGKLDLYTARAQSPGIPNGNLGLSTTGGGNYTVYYIGRENSDLIEKIENEPSKKKFIETLSKYTADCQDFLNKIKDKESIEYYFENIESHSRGDAKNKDSKIENMVNYYNNHCK